jgi:RHS repeat-associated protein
VPSFSSRCPGEGRQERGGEGRQPGVNGFPRRARGAGIRSGSAPRGSPGACAGVLAPTARGETYFGGRYLGTQTPSGFIYAYADGLGSERVRSNGEHDTSWPFGEFANFQNGVSPMHFTGKPYDSETGLDYFGARYYSPSLGRFMTPDRSASPDPVP